jgi:hypothetical protein
MPEKYCNTEQLEVQFNSKIAYYRMPNSGICTRKKITHLGRKNPQCGVQKNTDYQTLEQKLNMLQGSGNETKEP